LLLLEDLLLLLSVALEELFALLVLFDCVLLLPDLFVLFAALVSFVSEAFLLE
jgi:hypothetical protein